MTLTFYLLRHGEPMGQVGVHRCISRTDCALDEVGLEQADALGEWLTQKPLTAIYTSPARRCMETAERLPNRQLPVRVRPGLWEVSVGDWEGLSFSEIRRRWPETYADRGAHLGTVPPPGGESFADAARRMERTMGQIAAEVEGDCAIVTHSGLLRAWLATELWKDLDGLFSLPQPYGCVNTVLWDGAQFQVQSVGRKPLPYPGDAECRALLKRAQTPPAVVAHGEAVAQEALRLAAGSGAAVNNALLACACRLHDVCREAGRTHPQKGADLLRKAGYPQVATLIRQHHDLEPDAPPEAELLYLADKRISGTERVDVSARFAASRLRCTTAEALAAWQRRYNRTILLEQKYSCI
ncbi:MAG: histidine phosphatase family protein [Clostridiales bacterium]|nr:histidine phosphatase family protein [Clostridiales bacterium]